MQVKSYMRALMISVACVLNFSASGRSVSGQPVPQVPVLTDSNGLERCKRASLDVFPNRDRADLE